ncbi:MAG: dihydropteroate synthase [Gammaproteobacteria bacterium]|nr:dihydropteroate synthase [Pseudomaricurvus alcaniphilus]MBR9912932.1 dihydropteroate synthase [Gammaproteobacteria bacterium]NHN39475.1 dihydropteroate synthase [Pseudomaricurvus alcaniphilus]
MTSLLRCGKRNLDLSRPAVMGILNTTPDSFSDGGQLQRDGALDLDSALARARDMVAAGADILDIGGESTRPGAEPVSVAEELRRVIPLVAAIDRELDVVISVDTSTPEVMHEAAAAGAGLINDVRALQRKGAMEAAAATGLPVCLMHMRGEPKTMQQQTDYQSVVAEVLDYLLGRAGAAQQAGISADRILLDPGFGFAKSLEQNLSLVRHLPELAKKGYPILVGMSRKSMLGPITGRDVDQRLAGSLALALLAAQSGAKIIRVHDVRETVDVLRVWSAVGSAV